MSSKPIFVATHPRACSTAFERVFMTRRDTLQCVHEPFGDAFYFGPERLSDRYEKDEKARQNSGFEDSTYRTILDRIERENSEGKRIFIKDITHYLVPPERKPASTAPSLLPEQNGTSKTNGDAKGPLYPYNTPTEDSNPTVLPQALLSKFHFTFLIRHPRYSIPSYWRCTIPPLDKVTGFYNFMPSEAGYDELRRTFDYLKSTGQVGPRMAGRNEATNGAPTDGAITNGDSTNGATTNGSITRGSSGGDIEICVIDADDLLDNPTGIIQAFCQSTGLKFTPEMLKWETEEHHAYARDTFEKWKGFHEDAINSTELKARTHKKQPKPDDELYAEWVAKYGQEGADVIKQTVADNVADYEYLKSFAIKL